MSSTPSSAKITYDADQKHLRCEGRWAIHTVEKLKSELQRIRGVKIEGIDGSQISYLDSAGALTLLEMQQQLSPKNKVKLIGFSSQYLSLFEMIEKREKKLGFEPPPPTTHNTLYKIGQEAIYKLQQAQGFILLLGDLSSKIVQSIGLVKRLRVPSIMANIQTAGLQALPIVALLSFLIGVVLAYQMGLQLKTYGASIFIAYLSGLAVFREFGPLITAIIIAGRTSSAFTAQIGSMKINEEIDALNTMGLSPTELLVMPKVLALLIIFPLLIFWADCFSIMGAMYMSKNMLDVGYYDFLLRLKDAVGFKQMMLGLYKAPTFALLISLVGCFQGFQVESNSDSIGTQTTKSVVQALFLIIIADAIYSVIYSWLDL